MANVSLWITLCAGLLLSLPATAKLYKWVDENGVTQYGETIPPQYADKSRVEINKAGRASKAPEALTPDQQKAKVAAEEKQRADKAAWMEQKRRDMALVNTYTNEKEIDLARDRNTQQLDAKINSISFQLKQMTTKINELIQESERFTNASKNIPESLKEELLSTRARQERLQKELDKIKSEKTTLEAKFATDKARFKELTGK